MNLILRYKKEIIAALGIVILYFATRLILVGNLPIFTDEAIYTRWAQIAANDANWRFISLTDGKQPMFIWIGMIFIKLIKDPLVAIRLVSVLSGFFSLIGIFLLTRELFKNRYVVLLSGLLYVLFPFSVVYDRMALYDSMVGAFAVWAIYLSILLVRRLRLDIAYTLGAIIGGGMLTKSNADFSIMSLPFTLLLFNFKQKLWKKQLLRWVTFALVSAALAEVMYNSLRLSPFFHIIKEKNSIFIYYPFSIPLSQNFQIFVGNLGGLLGWLLTYLTPFYAILIAISFISKKFIKEKLMLLLYFALPFLAFAFVGKVLFPRHILFASYYLIPLASYGLFLVINWVNNFMTKRKLNIGGVMAMLVILLFLLYPAKVSFDIILNPASAAIADSDKAQYVTDWPAGGGVKESIVFFQQQAKNQKIFVGTEGTYGLMPAGLDIYLNKNPNVTTKGYWPINDQPPTDLLNVAQTEPTYVVFYQPCPECKFSGDAPASWPLTLVSRVKKSNNAYYSVYKVNQ